MIAAGGVILRLLAKSGPNGQPSHRHLIDAVPDPLWGLDKEVTVMLRKGARSLEGPQSSYRTFRFGLGGPLGSEFERNQ